MFFIFIFLELLYCDVHLHRVLTILYDSYVSFPWPFSLRTELKRHTVRVGEMSCGDHIGSHWNCNSVGERTLMHWQPPGQGGIGALVG